MSTELIPIGTLIVLRDDMRVWRVVGRGIDALYLANPDDEFETRTIKRFTHDFLPLDEFTEQTRELGLVHRLIHGGSK